MMKKIIAFFVIRSNWVIIIIILLLIIIFEWPAKCLLKTKIKAESKSLNYYSLLYGKPSSRAIPCALIGSFSVRILQYGPFPWKRSNPCIFVMEQSRQIQNLQPRQQKKKCENCHSSHWNYQQELKRLKFFRNFKDGWRRQTFLSVSQRKCVLLSGTECHVINYLLTELARAVITQENYRILNRERIYTGGLTYNYVQDPVVMKKYDDNRS